MMIRHPLEKILNRYGVTKREIARRVGTKYENSLRWYKPGHDPKLSLLKKIAKGLDIPVHILVRELLKG